MFVSTNNKELLNTRLVKASREKIWRAFEDPDRLCAWWGSNGFRNVIHKFEFKPGGGWDITMYGPNRNEFHVVHVFNEIEKPGKIVFTHLEPVHVFKATFTFEEDGPKTKVTFHMLFELPEEEDSLNLMQRLNDQMLERLEAESSRA